MNEYDFSRLNDKEFEVLCTDLMSAEMRVRFERFKPGRDSGVDGRYFTPSGREWILQAKHWISTSFSQLITHLKNVEAVKVAALNPERYLLVLSHPLSRADKTQINTIFSAHTSCRVDVYGREDLNDLLAAHREVERRHFKLWITSSTVLASLLNNAIDGRSNAVMDDILEKSKIYVPTSNLESAIKILEQFGTVIITGQAGIGKTTLAEQLILNYASRDFQLLCISEELREAEQAYLPDQPQIFYFDDFLGKNYLEALSGHEGSQIVNFIKRVARDKTKKKFILTSRSTILNQGRILNDAFDNNNIDRNEMEIKLSSLSRLDKAHILYNHIWHSNLNPTYIDELYANKRYHDIIEHPNFNPRIIHFITDPQRLREIPSDQYWNYINEMLQNPAKIWEHPFDSQLDDFGRLIVLLVAFGKHNIPENELTEAYARAITMPVHASLSGKRDFHVAIRHLTNSLLTRVVIQNRVHYKLFNPSLNDFLLYRYAKQPMALETILKCLREESVVDLVLDMARNDYINQPAAIRLLESLFDHEEKLNFENSDPEYIAKLCMGLATSASRTVHLERIKKSAPVILTSFLPKSYLHCLKLLLTAANSEIIQPSELTSILLEATIFGADENELSLLGEILNILELHGIYDVSNAFTAFVQNLVSNDLDGLIDDTDLFYYGYDLRRAEREFERLISQKLLKWGIQTTPRMIDEITDGYDLESRMNVYFANQEEAHEPRQATQQTIDLADIDDLFHRDR